jgi:AcrR family transcriptional regulator
MRAPRTQARRRLKTDGRVLRGARNHALIVQALYELIRDGDLQPTAEQVAKRAGVGTRTVFRQFADLDSLYESLSIRLQGELLALVDLTPPTGKVQEDVPVLVSRRARLFEHLAPFRRAGRLVRHTSAYLQDQDATITAIFRDALRDILGPHVAEGDADTLEALDALLSFEAWDRLRDQQELGVKRAEQVLVRATIALLKGARAAR